MKHYKVQVLLSTYNGESFIDEQITSLLAQEGVELQISIRDDGSTDRTVEKIKKFIGLYPNKIVISEGSNIGVVNSFFDLIRRSSSEYDYYAFCDQDDVWENNKLIRAISYLNQKRMNQPLMYCSSTKMVDEHLAPLGIWPNPPQKQLTLYNALIENVCVGCTILINSEAMKLLKKNLPNNLNNIIMHDWWVYLCVSAFGEVMFDKEPSILYRQHQTNVLGGLTEGLLDKWRNRLRRFLNGKNHNILSNQAKEFMSTYTQLLNNQQFSDIQKFLSTQQKSIFQRVLYTMKSPFYRQSILDNIVYKIVFIAGKI